MTLRVFFNGPHSRLPDWVGCHCHDSEMNTAGLRFILLAEMALGAVSACHVSNSLREGDAADLRFAEASADKASTPIGGERYADVNVPGPLLAEAGADRPSTPDSRGSDADVNVPGPPHDCFPDCVKTLRAGCERPPVNAGWCEMTNGAEGAIFCYSNGVHELAEDVNGGELVVMTQPDGQTVCYQISVDDSTGVQHFQTPSGQEVAQVVGLGGGIFSVTCNGTTQTVDNNDPTCATLNSTDCKVVVVACP